MISLRQTFKSPQTLSHKREKNTEKGKSEKKIASINTTKIRNSFILCLCQMQTQNTRAHCRSQLLISIQNTLTGDDVTLSMTEVYEEYKNLS